MLFVVGQDCGVFGGNLGLAAFLHDAQSFADEIHVVAEVADAVVGDVLHLFVESGLVADVADQGAESEHGIGGEILVADVGGHVIVGVADNGIGADVFVDGVGGLLGDGDEILGILIGDGVVERVGGGNGADQDQHDQAHAFLSIVRAVEKADAGAGEDEQAAYVERWRGFAFGSGVEFGIFDEGFGEQEQERGATEANDGREQQGFADVGGLSPVDAAG